MSHDIGFYSNMPKVCMVHGKQIKNVAWRKFVQQHVKSMYWFMENILQNTNKKMSPDISWYSNMPKVFNGAWKANKKVT